MGVFVVRIWQGLYASANIDTSAQSMLKWVENADETIIEVNDDELYIQEAIGSIGTTLKYPTELKEDFEVSFQLLSLTQKSSIKFLLQKEQNSYELEILITPQQSKIKLSKNNIPMIEKNEIIISPNKYYTISLIRKKDELSFFINEGEVLKLKIAPQTFTLKLTMQGLPHSPAAFIIRDFEVYKLPNS